MPKHPPSGSPCLNPIAHTFFEHPSVSKKRNLVVEAVGGVEQPVIRHQISHPMSPYVVRLEMEHSEATAAPVASNFLSAQAPAAIEENDGADIALTVLAAESLAQQDVEIRFPQSGHLVAPPPPVPIVDTLAVDDLVSRLEFFMPDDLASSPARGEVNVAAATDGGVGAFMDSDDTPLVTLDELLDDVSLSEELADIPRTPRPRRARVAFKLPEGWSKTIALFVGLSFVLVLPIRAVTVVSNIGAHEDVIFGQGKNALASIQNGANATLGQEFALASSEFNQAASSFEVAQEELRQAKTELFGLADVLPSARRATAQGRRLLLAGEAAARAAGTLTNGMQRVANRTSESPAAAVSLFDVFVEQALPDVWSAAETLRDVQVSALPAEHRATLRSLRQGVEGLAASLQAFHDSADAVQALLGHRKRQRYLVLFQNNTELRPTGGFWGSFAEIDVLDGKMESIRIPGGGTYDMQGQLTQNIAAPAPLQLVRGRWELQDSNWYPDFPSSAQNAMWFYEQSGGPSVDGVMAINADLVAKLIDVVGPISMPEYGLTVDGETFLFETQRQVEVAYDRTANTPKAFIGDLAPVLLERLTNAQQDTFLQVVGLIGDGLSAQDIQIYHSDPSIQSAIERLGWDGGVRGNTGDYLMVTHANIGGGKTDGVMSDTVAIESSVRPDGRIENTVTISRTHNGIRTATFSGKNNVSFSRLYVPRGSTLISLEGAQPPAADLFESVDGLGADLDPKETGAVDPTTGAFVGEGFGKTIFGAWMQTGPGTSSTITVRYLLPEDILDEPKHGMLSSALGAIGVAQTVRHSIFIQKQPGVAHRETTYRFSPGNALRPVWSTNSTVTQFSMEQNTNGFFGMVLERP